MPERKYVIIESLSETFGGAGTPPPGGPAARGGLEGFGGEPERLAPPPAPATMSVRTERLDEKQVAEARRPTQPGRQRMVLEPMPIALVRPMAKDGPAAADAGGDSWGIEATNTHNSNLDGNGVTVAVLDTGIDLAHPAFAPIANRIEVRNFTDDGGDGHDNEGHGSHCAGTIFGQDVGGRRIGIARGIEKALIGKVLSDDGRGDSTSLFDAMTWAAQENAQVISMSLGFDHPGMVDRLIDWYDFSPKKAASEALVSFAQNLRAFDALLAFLEAQSALGRDALVVAASGNESAHNDDPAEAISSSLPSATTGVLSVGALGRDGANFDLAPFSNINVDLCAPGVDIISAEANSQGLVPSSGTSMACPHVAGVAALWWQQLKNTDPNPSAVKVREKLFGSATKNRLPQPPSEAEFGRGRVIAP